MPKPAERAHRVGVIVDAAPLPTWQQRLCEKLWPLAEIRVFGVQRQIAVPRWWRHIARRVSALRADNGAIAVRTVLDRAAALEAAQAADLDLVIDCTAAEHASGGEPSFRLGLWTLRQKDGRPAGAPFAFLRDMADARPEPTITLVRDGTTALFAARPQVVRGHYVATLDRLFEIAAMLPARALAGETAGAPWRPEAARPFSAVPALARIALQAMRHRWWASLSSEWWVVGVIDKPIGAVRADDLKAVRWIGPWSNRRYWADPFGVPGDPNRFLCEEVIHENEIGTLKEITLDANLNVSSERDVAVSITCHLSYPYMYVDQGTLYCIPESNSAGRAVIHRKTDSTARWEPHSVPLDGVRAVDSSLFFHDGLYWLAYTDEDRGPNDTLFLAWSERLEGPWHQHRLNPVKIDVRSSRPAGTVFRRGDALMRPAQDCSRTYGGAIVINRITTLTPDDFAEEPVEVLRPLPGTPAPDGLHHLGAWGERTLIDGKREWINPWVVRYRFGRKLRKLNPFRGP